MIKIIDNFLDNDNLKIVQDFALNKALYTPRYFMNTTKKNEKNYYGSRFLLNQNKKLLNLLIKQSELKFKIKIKKVNSDSGLDIRSSTYFKPHTDEIFGIANILIMISGPTAVTNGTVFYYTNNEGDSELDIHVGFRENRAILFPSNWMHSQHAVNVSNLKRYTSTLFIDYEE